MMVAVELPLSAVRGRKFCKYDILIGYTCCVFSSNSSRVILVGLSNYQ